MTKRKQPPTTELPHNNRQTQVPVTVIPKEGEPYSLNSQGVDQPVSAEDAESPLAVSVSIPLGTSDGYLARNVSIKRLTQKQSENLKRLLRGLENAGAKLDNGTVVKDVGHALRFVLEQF